MRLVAITPHITPAQIDSGPLSVQFGCGLVCPDGWLNFDVSPTMLASKLPFARKLLRLPPWSPRVRYGDIVAGLPVPDGSCARVYSDQVLEHLCLADCRKALSNVLGLLQPGGVFRFFVPDLEFHVQCYLRAKGEGHDEAAHRFSIGTGLGIESKRHGVTGRLYGAFGNSRHLWSWDEASMRKELADVGFQDIRRIYYRDSIDPEFRAIEEYSEFKDSPKCLGIEARRSGAAD